ncbi:hypothetical protein DFH28DRAFT_958232 [Melampsora americana]|nr:hypothetical protein DFH28DRAFT_958232 [Melampsora americana]
MSSSTSMNNKTSSNSFGLLSPFVFPATSGPLIGQNRSTRKVKNRDGKYLDGTRSSADKVGRGSTSLQSPFSSPVATRECKASGSSRRFAEPSSECTQAYSTPIRYHLPTRLRATAQPEVSCFESDDEDHEGHLRLKKALALASEALARCTRRRANSAVSLKGLKHTNQKVRAHEATRETQPKTRQSVADEQWTMERDPKSLIHKVQWSGSTLNSVTEAYTSLVPMCRERETRELITLKEFGPAMDCGLGCKEEKRKEGCSSYQWIEWHGSNPFEIKQVSWLSRLKSPGPPPTCPLPPLPTDSS